MAFQILSEAPNTERAPSKWSQGSASVYILYFPFQFPALHTPSLCLLCCVPPAATETLYFVFSGAFFTAGSLRPNFLLFLLPSLFFFLSLLLMNVDDIDFPELHLSQDYRLQGAREALHSQRIQIYPTCSDPWQPSQFFFLATRGSTINPACMHSSKPAKADFTHFCLVVVKFWSPLAPI